MEWWHWIIVGVALLGLDIALINVYFLVWFGLGAVGAGLALLVAPALPMWGQLAVFVGVAAATLVFWIYWVRPVRARRRLAEERVELIGSSAVVVRCYGGRGTLRLQKPVGERDVWTFAGSHAFSAGDNARVVAVDDEGVVTLAPIDAAAVGAADSSSSHSSSSTAAEA